MMPNIQSSLYSGRWAGQRKWAFESHIQQKHTTALSDKTWCTNNMETRTSCTYSKHISHTSMGGNCQKSRVQLVFVLVLFSYLLISHADKYILEAFQSLSRAAPKFRVSPDVMASTTLQGTNISHQKWCLEMIFPFPRWDMLIPWRVILDQATPWLVQLHLGPNREVDLPHTSGPGPWWQTKCFRTVNKLMQKKGIYEII